MRTPHKFSRFTPHLLLAAAALLPLPQLNADNPTAPTPAVQPILAQPILAQTDASTEQVAATAGQLGTAHKGGEYRTLEAVSYLSEESLAQADPYQREQCRMDLYLPQHQPGFATVIWLHGGGLISGTRYFPELKEQGYGLVSVSYRLWPQAGLPTFIEDAAAATAWVIQNIARYGGDPDKVFIAGHSAGGYLAAIVGMDSAWLSPYGVSNRQLAGIIPVSAQVTTHFTVKRLQGDTGAPLRPLIDSFAPLYHAAGDLPPICIITGDRALEWESRVEENALLAVTLRNLGHPLVEFHELPDKDHNSVVSAAYPLFAPFIQKVLAGNTHK